MGGGRLEVILCMKDVSVTTLKALVVRDVGCGEMAHNNYYSCLVKNSMIVEDICEELERSACHFQGPTDGWVFFFR